ncbi:NADH-quinone oxidoreductase subunit C [Streptomyces sp. NPDC060194]|uniref:NADH-quinone oxidoreductase subunit C n=1 Tax=Streptomyces sp. NPDC060194 TaxID=3347069 RepID=UPI0036589AD1
MSDHDRLPEAAAELFGEGATGARAYDLLTVDVPPGAWVTALETARDTLGCTYFDWLSAVDEPGTGFRVCAHVAALGPGSVRRLLLRTTVPHDAPRLPTAVAVYAGAAWHERETHEMFGVVFDDHPGLDPLLLPENFEGHPLRKDFVLAARVAKAWPGAKEPGEAAAGHAGPKRRQMLPPGVPDPNDWGPLKGQLPPAPARPARTPRAGAAAGAGAGADRPVRRTRSVSEGSASQAAAPDAAAPDVAAPASVPERSTPDGPAPDRPAPDRPVRRSRSASQGSVSQTPAPDPDAPPAEVPAGPAEAAPRTRRNRSVSEGSASQAPAPAAPAPEPAPEPAPAPAPERPAAPTTRSSDAPWHQPRPTFDAEAPAEPSAPEPPAGGDAAPDPTARTRHRDRPDADPDTPAGGHPA